MYEELVERLKCPRIHNCPVNEQEISCKKCCKTLIDNAADAIETLTAKLTEKSQDIKQVKADYDRINDFDKSQCAKLLADLTKIKSERDEVKDELDQVKRERDILLTEITGRCTYCLHNDPKNIVLSPICRNCINEDGNRPNWLWRGVQEEELNDERLYL